VPPGGGGDPTDAQVIQDLGLLQGAGFTLLRIFASDAVGEQIVRLAESNYPALKIHLGVYLEGATASCVDAVNTTGIANLIRLANQYSNVVAVSVGNETSFAANLPVGCLANYIQTVRSQVTQPVTADDDYSFYAGLTASGEKPDTIIPLLDFVSIHIYAFTESGNWDWRQTGVATLYPDRASAMMNAAMTYTRSKYDLVANRSYTTASGATTTIGASLPIVIGETGWKAGRPNGAYRPPVPIENYSFSATPPTPVSEINNKWFYDLSSVKASWSTAPAAAPKTIFFFEAFDEPWKKDFIYSPGDDGWGLWDVARTPRYALCGTYAAAPACASPDVYLGAGYFH
jgi:exo-beta-1,3-glucanase (GH17 family)